MADRPIIFSGPMVQALLDGRKTQTRRLIEPYEAAPHPFKGNRPAPKNLIRLRLPARLGGFIEGPAFNPRYAVGDRLYVREHWRTARAYDDLAPSAMGGEEPVKYEADGTEQMWGWPGLFLPGRFRQGMHMPRWASRLTLTVTEVRVQRLQEITYPDVRAEGLVLLHSEDPRDTFRALWNSLHGPDAWGANPWVCAISFTVRHGNIDQEAAQ